MTIELTPEQQVAMDSILEWYRYGSGQLTLGGYAGTGKTTLLGLLPEALRTQTGFDMYRPNVHFCSFTGKAVSVLKSKLPPGSATSTIHRLLYHPRPIQVCIVSGDEVPYTGGYCETHMRTAPPGKALLFAVASEIDVTQLEPAKPAETDNPPCETKRVLDWSMKGNPLDGIDLVVVDEASMVSEKIWTDLTKWGVPVLAVGDHGQLEPIKSDFNLMANPQLRLEKILRQVADSPIIKMSIMARLDGRIPVGQYGPNCVKLPKFRYQQVLRKVHPDNGDLVICAYNRTRNEANTTLRRLAGRSGPVTVGDVVICLRNSYELGVFNGMRGTVYDVGQLVEDVYGGDHRMLTIQLEGEDWALTADTLEAQWNQPKTLTDANRRNLLFDFGYAMTCHKAQGSQADRVLVLEEYLPSTDHHRWLYTAVTRAAKELCVVGGR